MWPTSMWHTSVFHSSMWPPAAGPIVIPPALDAIIVNPAREWRLFGEGDTAMADNVIVLHVGDEVTLSMDFSAVINKRMSLNAVGTPIDTNGQSITMYNARIAKDHRRVHVDVSGLVSGKEHRIKIPATSSDGLPVTGEGVLQIG